MAEAREIALRYMSPRYCRLERFEKYVEGTQYDGKFPFMGQGEDAPPIQERAPCVVYGVAKNAIQDLVDFIAGEGRYPQISAASSEDDEDLDDEWGLDEDASALLERWVNGPLSKASRLRAAFSDALTMAMTAGGVAVVGAVRNGQPCLQALPAKWCTPSFDPMSGEVIALEVFYPYLVEVFSEQERKWVERCLLYKRRIDAQRDVVFLPGEGRADGTQPAWQEDPAQTVTHGLGFCPVRWFAFDRREPTAAHFDGKPLHQFLLDEIDALNMALSMRHRAAFYSGDPQIWETGVEADVNPAPMARFARVQVEAQAAGPNGQRVGVFTASPRSWGGRGAARKKGAGVVWRYPSELSKVGMLTLPDGSLGGIDEHASDLRKKIAEDLSVVLLDPTDVKAVGALSGKALAFVFARQVSRGDRIRMDAGDGLLLPCIDMLLRLCLAVHTKQPGGLRVPGMKKVAEVLSSFVQDVEVQGPPAAEGGEPTKGVAKSWFGPRLELQWGRYFPPSAEEENFIVTMCVAAKNAGLMPDEILIEKLRDVFHFGSAEELMERLEKQAKKKQEEALANQEAQLQVQSKFQPEGKGTPTPPKKQAPKGNEES